MLRQDAMRRERFSPARGHVKSRHSIESAALMQASSGRGTSALRQIWKKPLHSYQPPHLSANLSALKMDADRGSRNAPKHSYSDSFQYRPVSAYVGAESDMDDAGSKAPSDIPSLAEFIEMVHAEDRKAKSIALRLSESNPTLVDKQQSSPRSESALVIVTKTEKRRRMTHDGTERVPMTHDGTERVPTPRDIPALQMSSSRRRRESDTSSSVPQGLALLPSTRTGGKKPAVALTTWVRVWPSGESGLLQTEKSYLIQHLGIQARDFRILESQLTREACCILCREKCIILNLVFIRAIVTAQYVLLSSPTDDLSAGFLAKMKEKITDSSSHTLFGERHQEDQASEVQFPFELKALEIALDELALHLDHHAKNLEASIEPELDQLVAQVRTSSLNLMRRFKTRLVALKSTTTMVCAALEELLDDDDDMIQMSLTAKEQREVDLIHRVSLVISEDSGEGRSDSSSTDHELHVSQVEMLLDAYFTVYDNIFNRLQDLIENIANADAEVNIKLDAQRNKLLAISLVMQAAESINMIVFAASQMLNMNLIGCPDSSMNGFLATVLSLILGCSLMFSLLIAYFFSNGAFYF